MADLVVITGPPGAGKSTVAALVVDRHRVAALVPGDAFYGFWTRGAVPPWLPEAHDQNVVITSAAARAAGAYVAGGCSVVFDGVVGPWLLPAFVEATGLQRVHYLMLLPDLDTCLRRVAGRVGHGFTDDAAARHMHHDFATASIPSRHVLRSESESPEEVAAWVLTRIDAGTLVYAP